MAKMKGMTPIKLAEVCGGTYFGPEEAGQQEISCLVTNSQEIEAGGMFVAIKGNKVDANRFIPATYEAGALCCMSENAPEEQEYPEIQEHAYIQVKSCLQALKDMATYYRMQCQVLMIGITGSVGKTTTKEMLASVLSQHYNVLKTQGNYNNEIGVPLTLFRLREEHEIAIVEMGISDFGEMSRLTAIAKPDMCVITNIGPCHLENLGDLDGVLRAKTEIFEGLPEKKHADIEREVFLYGDDEKLCSIQEVNGRHTTLFFGMSNQNRNEVFPSGMEFHGLRGTDVTIKSWRDDNGISIQAHVPVPGKHMIINALVAAAIGHELHLWPDEIARGIEAFRPVEGHGNIIETERFILMNDCYNANPFSMKAGLDVLAEVKERKVAILGDMFELGAEEEKLHYEIGVYAAEKGINLLIFVGTLAKQYHLGAKNRLSNMNRHKLPEIHYFASMEEAQEKLPDLLKTGDAILVKASHGMHFEKIVASLEEM